MKGRVNARGEIAAKMNSKENAEEAQAGELGSGENAW